MSLLRCSCSVALFRPVVLERSLSVVLLPSSALSMSSRVSEASALKVSLLSVTFAMVFLVLFICFFLL